MNSKEISKLKADTLVSLVVQGYVGVVLADGTVETHLAENFDPDLPKYDHATIVNADPITMKASVETIQRQGRLL